MLRTQQQFAEPKAAPVHRASFIFHLYKQCIMRSSLMPKWAPPCPTFGLDTLTQIGERDVVLLMIV
jgi:hypothetical protein